MLALALAVVAAPEAARASTVAGSGEVRCNKIDCQGADFVLVGDPGEQNRFTALRLPSGEWVVRDDGAPRKAGHDCVQIDAASATCSGPRKLRVDGADGDDTLSGVGLLIGGVGNDVLNGTDGHDVFEPGPGADRVFAGSGNDQVVEERDGFTADVLDGGEGVDMVSFRGRRTPVTADFTVVPQVAGSEGEANRVTGFETAYGGGGDDSLRVTAPVTVPTGRDAYAAVYLGGGDDRLEVVGPAGFSVDGEAGDDVLIGSDGPDSFVGGPGRDRLVSGAGDDVISNGADSRPDVVRTGAGDDEVSGTDAYSRSRDREDIDGGPGDDDLRGNGGRDKIAGGDGDDQINGLSGADTLTGGRGRDSVAGGGGTDVIRGGPGRDTLTGEGRYAGELARPAIDRLFGGPGNDLLRSIDPRSPRRERADCGAGRDRLVADRLDRQIGCETVMRRKGR